VDELAEAVSRFKTTLTVCLKRLAREHASDANRLAQHWQLLENELVKRITGTGGSPPQA
jgi:hypothetical protein